jgi:hypothetical protein
LSVTELENLLTSGLSEAIAAAPVTASIAGTVVTGFYSSNEQTAQLGYGGMIDPQSSEFVYITSAITAPTLMSVITVAGTRKRIAGINNDSGLTSLTLNTPEDVRK